MSEWNALLYDNKHDFVAEYGKGLLVKQFFASDLELMSEKQQAEVIKNVEDLTRESLWNGSQWIADYRRLRAVAHIS